MIGPTLADTGAAGVNRGGEEPAARSRFWEDVRTEARATWGGRFRRLWIALAVALVVTSLIMPRVVVSGLAPEIIFGIGLHLWTLAVWGSAWLGADLMSLRFAANPDPLREWTPREFLARALGRLGPLYLLILVAGGVYAAHSVANALLTEQRTYLEELTSWNAAPMYCLGWTMLPLAAGLPYAALAALLSATARRPRRLLIAIVVVVFGTLFGGGGVYLLDRWLIRSSIMPGFLYGDLLILYALAPGFGLGTLSYAAIEDVFWGTETPFVRYCLIHSAIMTLYAVPPALATWFIAARRYRRHPRTAPPQFGA